MLSDEKINDLFRMHAEWVGCHWCGVEALEEYRAELFARAIEEAVRKDERSGSMVGQIAKERIPLCMKKVDGTATEEDLARLDYLDSILHELEGALAFGRDTFLGEDPRIKQARKEERERCAGVMAHEALRSSAAASLLSDASASIDDFKKAILAKLNEEEEDK